MTTIDRVGSSSTTKNQNGDRKERAGLEEETRERQEGIERERKREKG